MKWVSLLLTLIPSMAFASPYYNVYPIPKRYDYQPRKPMTLYELSPAGVIAHCGWAYACTYTLKNSCVFYMPSGKSAFYWRHESAHCNGWPANHPYP